MFKASLKYASLAALLFSFCPLAHAAPAVELPTSAQLKVIETQEQHITTDLAQLGHLEQQLQNALLLKNLAAEQVQLQIVTQVQLFVNDEKAVAQLYPQAADITLVEQRLISRGTSLLALEQQLVPLLNSQNVNIPPLVPIFEEIIIQQEDLSLLTAAKIGTLFVDSIPELPQILLEQYGVDQTNMETTQSTLQNILGQGAQQ